MGPRKTNSHTAEQLEAAVGAVKNGMPFKTAGKQYGIPRATLQFRCTDKFSKATHGPAPVLSKEEEDTIVRDNQAGGSRDGFGGPRTPQQQQAQQNLKKTQAQVDEVVGIMRVNVEKVLERDSKLSELDNRADALQQGASQFEQQAGKLKRKYWWKNIKMMIIMGVIALAVLAIIIVLIARPTSDGSSDAAVVTPAVSPAQSPTTAPHQ